MNWKIIFGKILKGGTPGALSALATVPLSGLTSKAALVSAAAMVGGAFYHGAFEAVHQMVTGTVAGRSDAPAT